MTHLLDDDLLLVARGELFGSDLLRAGEHFGVCTECRERAAILITDSGSEVSGAFYEEVEQTIALVESDRAPIATTLTQLKSMELALYAASKSVELASRRLDHQRGRVLFCQAWLLMLKGAFSSSREVAIRARAIFASLGDEVQLARTLVVDAIDQGWLRETTAAITTAREAAAIFLRHDEPRRARIARGVEASALLIVERCAEAAAIYQELLAVTAPQDPHRLHWLSNLAGCLKGLGEMDRAEEIALAVIASPGVSTETTLSSRWVCALVQARRGNLEDALERLQLLKADACAMERRTHEMVVSYTLAELLSALDRPQEAAAMARDVIAHFTEENIPSEARGAIALLREAMGRVETNLFDELESFRQSFPELFPRIPALRSTPSRPTS